MTEGNTITLTNAEYQRMMSKKQPMMVTIGYIRDDGDLAVLAVLNNMDEHLSREQFNELVSMTLAFYQENPASAIAEDVKAYVRFDAPDYLVIGDEQMQEYEVQA